MASKVKIVGREVIKAISPLHSSLPHDLLQLSLLDCYAPPAYMPVFFFYKAEDLIEIVSQKLKSSLSETLSRFYPLAGRIEGVSIKCTNEGTVFTEAHTDLDLSNYLENLDVNLLDELLPKIPSGESASAWPLLSVQATFFGSGSGVVIAICLSHKICDVTSLTTFVQEWAATAKGESNDELSTPKFAGATIYPPPDTDFQFPSLDANLKPGGNCVTNRFVFESSKIAELKRKARSERVPIPTRVEVISSLIWKCAEKASNFNLVAEKSSAMTQAVDLRVKMPSDVLSKDAIGNIQTILMVKKDPGAEFEICELVADIRKAKEEVQEMIQENHEDYNATTFGKKLMSRLGVIMSEFNPNMNLYPMSSWCRKYFYEIDFGWGCPIWVGPGGHLIFKGTTYALFMDTKDGEGIEAFVGLPEQDMLAFVHDQDLLSYASLNPSITF